MTEPFVPAELRLSDDDSYLVGIQRQHYVKIVPNQGSGDYTFSGTRQIEFNFNHGEATDWTQSYLNVDVEYSDLSSNMTLVSDCIDRVEFYIDSQEIFSTTASQNRKLINYLLLGEANNNWYDREAEWFLGANIPTLKDASVKTAPLPPQSGSRTYCLPMWVIHPSFAQSKVMPVLGSQIRVVLHLANPASCLNVRNGANSSYTLKNVFLHECRASLSPNYKQSLMNAVNSEEGFKINMIDFDVIAHQITNTTQQNLVVRNEHRNSKTLVLYNDLVARFDSDGEPCHQTLYTDLGRRTTQLRVECGSLSFLGTNGSKSVVEHFVHLERANGSLNNMEQSGLYNYRLYNGDVDTAEMKAGFSVSPLMVSLEKIQQPDTDTSIVNNGLSAVDLQASRELEITIQTGTAMNASNERLFSGLIYEKAVVFANGMVMIEH